MKNILLYIFIFTLALLTTSCAVKSGRYELQGGKWVFVETKAGFMNQFLTPGVDTQVGDYGRVGEFLWPLPGNKKISSHFGMRHGRHHDGVDIPARKGAHILSAKSGKVIYSGFMRGYGRVVVLEHKNGFQTVYGHSSKNYVKKGQRVSKGEVIALVGATGRATGNHLHFEIRKNNKVRNPEMYFPFIRKVRLAQRK